MGKKGREEEKERERRGEKGRERERKGEKAGEGEKVRRNRKKEEVELRYTVLETLYNEQLICQCFR